MKKIIYILFASGMLLGMSACQNTFLDLDPQDQQTDAVYFKKASDFKSYAAGMYSQLMGWSSPYGGNSIYNYMDCYSDLSAPTLVSFGSDVGRGTLTVPTSDNRWGNNYGFIRTANILLGKATAYSGSQDDINQYVGEAYFFRANAYFNLLKFFGGVPIVTSVLDTNSSELKAPRNSRYEVTDQILSDLKNAINRLPTEQSIPSGDKGRISKWAAEAFKARVLLYEATWRKYNGTATDFDGSKGPQSDQINDFLDESIRLSKDVMDNGGYSLWNHNDDSKMANMSNWYLFNLEDAGSNPGGYTKTSNNEFILYGVYDVTLRPGGQNLSHTVGLMYPSRKIVDMPVCTDGLPIGKSSLFQGYHKVGDEFKNRDRRLIDYICGGTITTSVTLNSGTPGYTNYKFSAYKYGTYRTDNTESANYPIIRLAEVHLNYAEALYERYGSITDDQLNESINKLRARAGVSNLTNALVSNNGLDMLTEIRRERTVELYMEGFRFDDLKRWGMAESALNPSRCGMVVGDASYTTAFKDATGNATSNYVPTTFVWGEEKVQTGAGSLECVVIDATSNHNFAKKDYLWPIPQDQINVNSNLKQNPGYK